MAENLPPHVQLIQTATAFWASRVLYVVAKLGLADLMAGGPKRAEDLAPLTRTHAPSLYRLMRTSAGLGLMTQDAERRFTLTPLGRALTTGAPGAARATVLTLAGGWAWNGFEQLLYSVETGKSGVEKALGEPLFDWLAKHPEDASNFSETMIGFHGMEPEAIVAAYDFSTAGTIVDVGGASGHLLATIIGSHPGPRGVLFDMPHVVTDAPSLLKSRGLTQRITVESGSFFDRVPVGGDIYLLSHIIHDWSESQCLTILGNCREAMRPDGCLLIIEMVLPEGNEPHPGKMLDIMMLVGPGGQERTVPEYHTLLGKAGLRVNRVVPTQSSVTIVEAIRS